MSDILLPAHIGAIIWLVSGLVLCAAETMAPGAFLIWIGLAASIVGAIAYLVTVDFTSQLVLFGILVAGLVLLGRRAYGSLDASPGPLPQSRAHAMVGVDFFLDEAIVRGHARIRVGDSSWRVMTPIARWPRTVRVIAVEEGTLLRVELT